MMLPNTLEIIILRFYDKNMIIGAEKPEEVSKIREIHMKVFGAETVTYHGVFMEILKTF